jgi:tetratricopeptide (TPR) repeat protein
LPSLGLASIAAFTLTLVALGPTRAAHATGNIEEAKAAFLAGKQAYERGDYEGALASFMKANAIQPAPSLSYRIGTTYEHLNRFADAAQWFEKYLEQAGAPSNDEEKQFQENLKQRIENLRRRAAAPPTTAPPVRPAAPPTTEVQPPPTTAYNPYYYPAQPYYGAQPAGGYYYAQPLQLTREQRLDRARRRRGSGIGLLVSGLVINVLGAGIVGAGTVISDDISRVTVYATGATFVILGVCLWAPGVAVLVSAQKEIAALERAPATASRTTLALEGLSPSLRTASAVAGGGPATFLFSTPAIRF